MANSQATLEKITAWAKRRGFVYPASDVYGGLANTYDYGPYGTTLKENLRQLWWRRFVQNRDDIYGIDSSIILKADIWEASGHTAGFADVMVEDKVSHKRYRFDHLLEEKLEKFSLNDKKNIKINFLKAMGIKYELDLFGESLVSKGDITDASFANDVFLDKFNAWDFLDKSKVDGLSLDEMSGVKKAIEEFTGKELRSPDGNALTEPKKFNQLFQTEIGIVAGEKNKAYLRGEIAQGLFMNFRNIVDTFHPDLPFGIGQAGKAFRNEITPGKFTFRTLEFDLMEFEYFFDKDKQSWEQIYEGWKAEMYAFAMQIGLTPENLRWRTHEDFERSFYSTRTEDLEYEFNWGFKEMWGLAYRTDYDLKNHMEKSGKDLRYAYQGGEKIMPHVIEPTFGLSRLMTVIIFDAYHEEEVNGAVRVVLKFKPQLAPVQVAVFPLQKDAELADKAKQIYTELRQNFRTEYDNAGNIGKMYRRQDEIGTPWCVTVDFATLEDGKVTVRDRDSMAQERVDISDLNNYFASKLNS